MISQKKEDIYNLPNAVSLLRILMAPVLLYFAFMQQPYWYLIALIFAEFTDVLDGFLARQLNQITKMGSHLDSLGDFVIYSTMAICAWILWPEILQREMPYFIIIVLSFTLPTLIGYIKFQQFTSYHTWSVKLAVLVTVIGYILLFTEWFNWPFRVAAFFCLYAAIEEIALTMLFHHEHVDVRSIWGALRRKREQRRGRITTDD
ncbi:MAG: CDP-alcohol phosphatidyltransferase family protein [Gammaproteobacteria bacterium]|nr:CDP-alcohol phosphatidyltransferase family protein [Gammaproteobacteria bacterium]